MSNPITICNKALIQIGAETIESFEDMSVESEACEAFYEDVVQDILTQRKWSFATENLKLSQLNEQGEFGFDKVYQLPINHVFIYNLNEIGAFKVASGKLYTNNNNVVIEYTVRAPENHWPSYFSNIVQYRMAAELAPAITGNTSRAQLFEQKYRQALGGGISLDGQNHTTQSFRSYAFLACR